MKKDFETRFMPDVKFKVFTNMWENEVFGSFFEASKTNWFAISEDGDSILLITDKTQYDELTIDEVSIYLAIPELVPEGMMYNKELDILGKYDEELGFFLPDVNTFSNAVDEYVARKEIINERENGFIKADLEKLDFSLVDTFAYSDLAFQLTVGAKKYSKGNWKKGDIHIYLSALERHIQDIKKALDEDDIEQLIDDTGIQHGGALLCNSMFVHYFIRKILKEKKC